MIQKYSGIFLLINTLLIKDLEIHKNFISLYDIFFSKNINLLEKEKDLTEFISNLIKKYCSKKEFGLPIHSYLINKKVHIAKDLLAENIAVSEVAQRSGFFDQSHLNRSFKRVFQLTPKEYQKNIFS